MPASLCMIVKNEEERLQAALESVKKMSCVDEMIVLDTGSTDRSIEIAKDMGATVKTAKWRNDFSWARNKCASYAKNDWVFILDGDEIVSDEGDLAHHVENFEGNGIIVNAQTFKEGIHVENFHSCRAYRKSSVKYKFAIHNQFDGLTKGAVSSCTVHAFYDADMQDQAKERLPAVLKCVRKFPQESHYAVCAAKSYTLLADWERVIDWSQKVFSYDSITNEDAASVYTWWIKSLLALNDRREARRVLARAQEEHGRFPDIAHLGLTMAYVNWVDSVLKPDQAYMGAPAASRRLISTAEQGAQMLGIPISIKRNLEQGEG